MFCRISEITTKIKRLGGSKVTETDNLAKGRRDLWSLVQELKTESESFQEVRKLECWVEIAKLMERYTVDFLSVEDGNVLVTLLQQIQTDAAPSRSNPDYIYLIDKLEASASAAIAKILSQQS